MWIMLCTQFDQGTGQFVGFQSVVQFLWTDVAKFKIKVFCVCTCEMFLSNNGIPLKWH